jgi:hypothetical protein
MILIRSHLQMIDNVGDFISNYGIFELLADGIRR